MGNIEKQKKSITKAFTLVEMLIVLVIFGILSTVMFRTYSKISDISFRTQREKNLNQELVYIGQVMQSLSDDYTIDFPKYEGSLISAKGIIETLYLTGKNSETKYQNLKIYSTGTCVDSPKGIVLQENHNGCWLEMEAILRKSNGGNSLNNKQTVALTNTGKILFTPVKFKIIPYETPENFYEEKTYEGGNTVQCNYDAQKESIAKCIGSNGFRMLTTAYIPYYRDDKWVNKVKVVVQNFFNN